MKAKTINKTLTRLCNEIQQHNYKEEILQLMTEQLADDTNKIVPFVTRRTAKIWLGIYTYIYIQSQYVAFYLWVGYNTFVH